MKSVSEIRSGCFRKGLMLVIAPALTASLVVLSLIVAVPIRFELGSWHTTYSEMKKEWVKFFLALRSAWVGKPKPNNGTMV